MTSRDIATFPLSQTQKTKLLKAGFRYLADIKDVGPIELSKELNISKEDALQILKIIKKDDSYDGTIIQPTTSSNNNTSHFSNVNSPKTSLEGKSAFELLQKEGSRSSIITFSQTIDDMLGGGVPIGGVPGIGKTQMGIQLAVDVQIPKCFDGVEGQCIYIDTEGSFVIERVVEIAEAMLQHIHNLAETSNTNVSIEDKLRAKSRTLENVLSNIIYYRIHDYVEQIALVNVLPSVLKEHKNVKLVILDSVTFHFRHDFEDMGLRARLLNNLAQNLMALAENYGIAVVLMNQMTTKVGDNESYLVPALGESWGHNCTNRVILYWRDGQRFAYLYKSPSRKAEVVAYTVTADGIR